MGEEVFGFYYYFIKERYSQIGFYSLMSFIEELFLYVNSVYKIYVIDDLWFSDLFRLYYILLFIFCYKILGV